MRVADAVVRQGNLAAVHDTSHAAELGIVRETVLLQEQEHIVLIDLDDAQVHRAQVHGAEGEDELAVVGKDGTVDGDGHGRGRIRGGKVHPEAFGEGLSIDALHALVDRQREVRAGVGLEVQPGTVVLDVDGLPQDAGEFDQAFAGSGGRERLAEADFHAGIFTAEDAGVDDLEAARGGDVGLAGDFLVEVLDFQGLPRSDTAFLLRKSPPARTVPRSG